MKLITKAPTGEYVAHVEIPRTGSTSVKAALRSDTDRHIPAVVMAKEQGNFHRLYSFSVVRHPFERSVAQYLHSSNFENLWSNFEDFVILRYWNEFRADIAHRQHNRLFWPCWKWISDYHGEQLITQWFRFEDAPWQQICKRLGITSQFPHKAKAEDRKGDWRYYHTPITRSIIEQVHAGDFERYYN